MAKTLQERYKAYLESLGYAEVYNDRLSGRKLIMQNAEKTRTYILSNGGSCRLSRTGLLKDSYDVADTMKKQLIAWEKTQ